MCASTLCTMSAVMFKTSGAELLVTMQPLEGCGYSYLCHANAFNTGPLRNRRVVFARGGAGVRGVAEAALRAHAHGAGAGQTLRQKRLEIACSSQNPLRHRHREDDVQLPGASSVPPGRHIRPVLACCCVVLATSRLHCTACAMLAPLR